MAHKSTGSYPDNVVTEISPERLSPPKCCSASQATHPSPNSYDGYMCSKSPDVFRSFNNTAKSMSPAASSGPFCRICHEGDYQEDLVSLCKCTGSVGMVHLSCIERWLSTRRGTNDKCEICNFTFETVRSPKSLLEWYRSDQGNLGNRHGILGDIACFSLITPLAAVSAFLCFEGAKRQVMWNNSVEAGCLMALATFLITIYIVWNFLTFRFHFKNYLRWRSVNQNVRLVHYRRKSTNAEDRGIQTHLNMSPNTNNGLSTDNYSPRSISPLAQTGSDSDSVNVTSQASNLCLTNT